MACSGHSERGYQAAIDILNAQRRPKRPEQLAIQADSSGERDHPPKNPGLRGVPAIQGMKQWLEQIGYTTTDIDNLNIIHVAGTKGKGSTCAWVESFLRAHGTRTGFPKKTGLYTSPHLISPEERIRVNFEPLSPDKFAKYFFDVWDQLSANEVNIGTRPRYLQLLLLVSFHAFICEGVEAAIIETHHGGEYDSTNVIENPVVAVITPLGLDHVQQLGPTIENIAWNKAGIFKRGALALSGPQDPGVTVDVLLRRAMAKGVPLRFVVVDDKMLPRNSPCLKPEVQMMNCSVALAAARELIRVRSPLNNSKAGSITEDDIQIAVDGFSWPGRFQRIVDGHQHWYLDSAHNEMSVGKAAEWFVDEVAEETSRGLTKMEKRALIFGQISSHRDAISVLDKLAVCLKSIPFDIVIFTTWDSINEKANVANAEGTETTKTKLLRSFERTWRKHFRGSNTIKTSSVHQALTTVKNLSTGTEGNTHCLITGSQLLVGQALSILQKQR